MTAIVIIVVLAAVGVGIAAALGAGPLVLILVPILLLVGGWIVLFGAARMRPSEVARRMPRREGLLGPGGPDDPGR
jgi:hypothetical protein